MPGIIQHLENQLLNLVLLGTAYTPSTASVFPSLYTVTPAQPSTLGTEVSAVSTGYARGTAAITFTSSTAGSCANSGTITFPTCVTTAWGTVVAIGVCDNQTVGSGNLLFFGPQSPAQSVVIGNTFAIASGLLVVTLS